MGVGLRDVSRQGSQPSPSLLEPSGQIWLSERKKCSDWLPTKGMEGSELPSAGHILTASRFSVCGGGGSGEGVGRGDIKGGDIC